MQSADDSEGLQDKAEKGTDAGDQEGQEMDNKGLEMEMEEEKGVKETGVDELDQETDINEKNVDEKRVGEESEQGKEGADDEDAEKGECVDKKVEGSPEQESTEKGVDDGDKQRKDEETGTVEEQKDVDNVLVEEDSAN